MFFLRLTPCNIKEKIITISNRRMRGKANSGRKLFTIFLRDSFKTSLVTFESHLNHFIHYADLSLKALMNIFFLIYIQQTIKKQTKPKVISRVFINCPRTGSICVGQQPVLTTTTAVSKSYCWKLQTLKACSTCCLCINP